MTAIIVVFGLRAILGFRVAFVGQVVVELVDCAGFGGVCAGVVCGVVELVGSAAGCDAHTFMGGFVVILLEGAMFAEGVAGIG